MAQTSLLSYRPHLFSVLSWKTLQALAVLQNFVTYKSYLGVDEWSDVGGVRGK